MEHSYRFKGISGAWYDHFRPYDRFGPWLDVSALYAFAFKDLSDLWTILYFGETDNIRSRMRDHERWNEAASLGATSVLASPYPGPDSSRVVAERDLIALWNPMLNVKYRTTSQTALSLGTGIASAPTALGLGLLAPSRR